MLRKQSKLWWFLVLSFALLAACGGQESGTLTFRANGEDFVRQGFVSKDGWAITFDHVYVTLADITVYQTDPPYDPHDGGGVAAQAEIGLDGVYTVDLAAGDANAEPILVGTAAEAPAGRYNAISWEMAPAESGKASGYPLMLSGTATKEGQTVDFVLKMETPYTYTCGEYVGDERKGILQAKGTADLEMTFHFDHIFGDAETAADDDLNQGAPGFDPFARAATNGTLDKDMAGLQGALSSETFQKLVHVLPTLGHVGEGHCHSE